MRIIRSLLTFLWIALSVIPVGTFLLIFSLFVSAERLWWWFAQPYLYAAIFVVRWVGGVKYRVLGLENLPDIDDNQRIILCPKHQSTWETFFIPSMTPHPLAYVFKRELLLIPFFGWAMARLDMVHIDRSARSQAWSKVADLGVKLMDKGKWVIMFPEGTRIPRGEVGVYKTGGTKLAVQTGAPVIPVAVTSAKCWPRKALIKYPGVVDFAIGPPIPSVGREPGELMQEVETWIEQKMRELDPEAYGDAGR